MRGSCGLRRLCGSLTGLLLLGSTLLSCGSSTQLEALQYQLTDIQRQIRQLQTDTARQDALEEIRGQLAAELASLRAAQGDHTDDLARLEERIAEIRTDLATTGFGIESLREQLGAAQEGLVALQEAIAAAQEPRTAAGGDSPTFADPQDLYQSSYDHFLRGNYTDAISGFRQYIDRFPNSDLADNATYWIGESYFSQGQFEEAIQAFGLVASLYPNSERIASSLLREGSARIELGDEASGRRALLAVVERYPQSDEAILARQQLDLLPASSP
ncbi:MAG TPA: tol-pal system protein YbgF [Thermoanaerobaculia bacterium]|nr:tol-pal system protein YbgF [Thermoanaerobaculia bacterium]